MGKEDFFINKQKGVLIAFEGISGCGKSIGVESLYRELQDKGFKTKVIEWNSINSIRKIVKLLYSKKILTSWIYSVLQWISFLLQYIFVIKPYLIKGYILIADRYIYTGQTRDSVNGVKQKFGKLVGKIIRKPDLVLFYNIDLKTCYERIEKRGKVLFHPDRKTQCNKELKDQNLLYLKNLQKEYFTLFNDLEVKKNTNIIFIPLQSSEATKMMIRSTVKGYVEQKINGRYFSDDTVIGSRCK